jgi:hypothetical protein
MDKSWPALPPRVDDRTILGVKRRVFPQKVRFPTWYISGNLWPHLEFICPERESRQRSSVPCLDETLYEVIPAVHPLQMIGRQEIVLNIWYLRVPQENILNMP